MSHAKDCPCMYCSGRRLGRQIEKAIKKPAPIEPQYSADDLKKWWPAKCPKCNWLGLSRDGAGGGAIADTGDYDDPLCPECFKKEQRVVLDDDAPAPSEAARPEVEKLDQEMKCGDVYFADRGQSSHSYPTLWMVLSSKSALEPHSGDIFGPEANWYALSAPAGDMSMKRGIALGRWQGKGHPDSPHVLQTQELKDMIYVGNFYDWAQVKVAPPSPASTTAPNGEK